MQLQRTVQSKNKNQSKVFTNLNWSVQTMHWICFIVIYFS